MMTEGSQENHNAYIVTNSEFLAHLLKAAPRGSTVWVNAFIGNPNGSEARWNGKAYNAAAMAAEVDNWARQNTYFSVGAVEHVNNTLHRRKSHFCRLLCLVADDVEPENLMATPSWGLLTSKDKRQIGIFLDERDPDCADLALVGRLFTAMAEKGYIKIDISGNNAVRYVRLPVGQNQKPRESGPWTHVLEYWNPNIRYSLADAAAAFGINLDELRKPQQAGERATLAQGEQDELLRILTTNIIRGEALHDSLNIMAASLVASGTAGGAVVNILRALMHSSQAMRDDRWQARYADIPRSVSTAQEKFRIEPKLLNASVDPLTGEILTEPDEELFEPVSSIVKSLSSIKWLVKDYLEMDALSMCFGPSGAGKSFVVADLAACVATGTRWMNKDVKHGAVFYIAGEGHNGLARRFAAWSKHHGVTLEGAPLFKSKRAISMLDPHAADKVRAEIERMIKETGHVPVLVIIDTLARNFGQGDENKQQDANRFIEHLDTYIRRPYGANVMTVHHSGHDMDRARGSSVFKAAMDQEFWVKGLNGQIELTTTKMKDAELPPPQRFRIKQIDLDVVDEDGQPITGAYIERDGDPLDWTVVKNVKGKPVTARQVIQAIYPNWPGRPNLATALEVGNTAIDKIYEALHKANLIERGVNRKDGWKVTEQAMKLSLGGEMLFKNNNADDEGGEEGGGR